MKVVVTGGAGFIGSNLARALLADHEVHIVDDLSSGKRENLPQEAVFHEGSILDDGLLSQAFEGAEVVFHQAARPSVARSIDDPLRSHEANATGTLGVLVAARDAGVKKVVYAGSSSAYGDTPTLPKQEKMPPRPKSPYAVGKLTGEMYCRVFWEVYGLRTTVLRYFNVYGPRQDPTGGYAAVIPSFIGAALRGEPLVLHGGGAQTRDFVFVDDAIQANVKAAASKAADGMVLNIGSGSAVSIRELAQGVVATTRSDVTVVEAPARIGDVRHSLADISLANELIGYKPQVGLDEGLEATRDWFQLPV